MAQFRDNNPLARMQYEKMPRFLIQMQSSMTKQNVAPVSGSTSIQQQTEQIIDEFRDEKKVLSAATSYKQVYELTNISD